MNEISQKISENLLSKLKDNSLKKEINNDLYKIKEGYFRTKCTDNWINKKCIEYINLIDQVYSQINEYKSNFKKHVKKVEEFYQSQLDGYKNTVMEKFKKGCSQMEKANMENIENFDLISKNVGITLQNISDATQVIKDKNILIEKSIKKLSDISEIRQQSFENVYDKLASINDIADESPWDSLFKKIKELIEKSDDNKKVVENFFKHLEDEAKRKQDKIDSNKETLKETRKNIDQKVNKLTKLKGIGDYKTKKTGKDGVLNREQIKSKIVDVNNAIENFNKNIEKYELKLNECIESKKELNRLKVQLDTKRKKFEEMDINHAEVRAKLETKYKEFRDIEDKIKKLDVYTYEYKNCNIIVRKNDLTEELSEAIVNPANEQLMHEGGAARAIADKGGDIVWEESKLYIKNNGNLPTGQATMTKAGKLPSKYIIHAVGPRYNKNLPDNSLAHAQMKMVTNSIMEIVKKENIDSVSIPAISTGIFGFPISKAAGIIGNTVKSFIDSNSSEMRGKTIVFCNFDDPTTDVFNKVIPVCFLPKAQEENDDEEDNNEESKNAESEEEDKTDSVNLCKSCKREITEKKHQANGKHLKICYKCYKEKKEQKRKEKERDEEDESDESVEAKKKRIKKKYRDAKNDSDQEEEIDTRKKGRRRNDDSDEEDNESPSKKDKKKKKKNKNKNNSDNQSDSQDSSKDDESQDESQGKSKISKNKREKDSKKKSKEDSDSEKESLEDNKKQKIKESKKKKNEKDDLKVSSNKSKESKTIKKKK